jgi:hypothetical protein
MLYTTRRLLLERGACQERYDLLVGALGEEAADEDAAIPLRRIFDLNGFLDTLWALRAVPEHQWTARDYLSRTLACEYAERVLPIFEAKFPADGRTLRDALFVARCFADGKVTPPALRRAYVTAYDLSVGAMGLENWAVARSVMWAATPDSPEEAACGATVAEWAFSRPEDRRAERTWQKERFLQRLEGYA